MKTTPYDPAFPSIVLDEVELTEIPTNVATIIVRHPGGKESRFFVRLVADDDDKLVSAFLETPASIQNRQSRPLTAIKTKYL